MMDSGKVSATGLSPDCAVRIARTNTHTLRSPQFGNVTSILLGLFAFSTYLYGYVKRMTGLIEPKDGK